MSEELLQRELIGKPEKIGKWDFYNIGATNIKSLRDNKILKNLKYNGILTRKPDGLLMLNGEVTAVISNKIPKSLKLNAEVKDWIEVTKKLFSKLLIVTDTKSQTYWINTQTGNLILDEKGIIIKNIFTISNPEIPKLIDKILDSINDKNDKILAPQLKDPTQLAESVWQDIWIVSGDDAENCLYTFVELFIFKYLSDLNVLSGFYSFNELLKKYDTNTSEEVLQFYADVIRWEIKNKFRESIDDKTTIINGSTFVNKSGGAVSGHATVFKKVLLKFKDYEKQYGQFDHIHYEFKSKIFETFLKESISKKNWGQYFTPLKVVRGIVKMAKSEIREGTSICDPACGVGKFLLEVIADFPSKYFHFKNGKFQKNINLIGFDKGFEDKEQKTIILAKANMLIYLSELIKENSANCNDFSNLFNETFKLQSKTTLGTLFNPTVNTYDLILTNPPYVAKGAANLKQEIISSGLEYHYVIPSIGVEGLFMEWIIRALKPNGKAFIIIPDGMLSRIPDKKLRKFISDECIIDAIISLPDKTFFTTQKKTSILAITKKLNNQIVQIEPIYTYIVNSIGETLDVRRFDIDQNDLDIAASLFNQFKYDKTSFKSLDERCKIISCDEIINEINKDWLISKFWNTEEKVKLKITEEDKKVDLNDLSLLLDDFSSTINTYQNQIKEMILEVSKSEKSSRTYLFKEVPIKELFNLSINTNGGKFTKDFVNKNKGDIPVYSASKDPDSVDYGYIKDNLPGIKYFENCLTWNIDGSIGKAHFRTGRFSLSEKVIPLILIEPDKFNIDYLMYEIEKEFAKHSFSYGNKASKGKIKEIGINIPITDKGEYNLSVQNELAEKSKRIIELKVAIKQRLSAITESNIELYN